MRSNWPPGLRPKQIQFLEAFAECGTILGAAEAVGISRRLHYKWLERPAYREAVAQARQMVWERLVGEAIDRARDRRDRASARLLVFLINRLDPEGARPVNTWPPIQEMSEEEIDTETLRLFEVIDEARREAGASETRGATFGEA